MDASSSVRRPRPVRRQHPRFRGPHARPGANAYLDAIALAVVVIAPDGYVIHSNRAVESLLGWQACQIVGRHITALFPVLPPPRSHNEFVLAVSAQQLWAGALSLRCSSGNVREVYVSATPIGERPGGVVASISAARLHQQHELLGDTAASTNQHEQRAAAISQFAHDIRNPLTMILASTQLAVTHADDHDYVEECLTRIERAANRLTAVADRLVASIDGSAAYPARTPVEPPLNVAREE
ncbi:MAG TPA: PAS domain-containing protein [Roseiflexaceae bacterium]|nr:PAS domain-containing protein [Roseiflexaceae bacterium]